MLLVQFRCFSRSQMRDILYCLTVKFEVCKILIFKALFLQILDFSHRKNFFYVFAIYNSDLLINFFFLESELIPKNSVLLGVMARRTFVDVTRLVRVLCR